MNKTNQVLPSPPLFQLKPEDPYSLWQHTIGGSGRLLLAGGDVSRNSSTFNSPANRFQAFQATWPVDWSSIQVAGKEDIPVLGALPYVVRPASLASFREWKTASNASDLMLHFYVQDEIQRYAVEHPLSWSFKLSRALAVIAPDLSLMSDFPQCERRTNTRSNRLAAAVWQRQGIDLIGNARWNDPSDYDYCFDGLPEHAQIAVSSLRMLSNDLDTRNFVHGYQEMLERLSPTSVIFHGRMPKSMPKKAIALAEVMQFPSRKDVAHGKAGHHGRG